MCLQVCEDAELQNVIDTIDTIVYHVAAHEIGHAIYGLDAVKDIIKVRNRQTDRQTEGHKTGRRARRCCDSTIRDAAKGMTERQVEGPA
jgi:hypothetical protein